MATAKNQAAYRLRKKLNLLNPVCANCSKTIREDSRKFAGELICQACWFKTPEGKTYRSHQVYTSNNNNSEVITLAAKEIANKHKKELGFVNIVALRESAEKQTLYCEKNIGFVHWHNRRDGQTTIYSLAVNQEFRFLGWGRLLFYKVLCNAVENKQHTILLKCPEDLSANDFYEKLGFKLIRIEPGKKRKLNVWEFKIVTPFLFYCADGGRNEYGKIAKQQGWLTGFRSDTDCLDHSMFVDNHFEDYNHERHLSVVKKCKPLLCTAKDIYSIEELPLVLKQARELAKYCGRVLIIPKVKTWLPPSGFWIGYSVPTSYGGTEIEIEWFNNLGMPIHLLGGSPKKQSQIASLLNNVVSLDGNYAMRVSQYGKACSPSGEVLKPNEGCYQVFKESLKLIKDYWHSKDPDVVQLTLF